MILSANSLIASLSCSRVSDAVPMFVFFLSFLGLFGVLNPCFNV